ncbi:hypothetical protein K7957_18690 [Sphingomonas yunnanensis]|uniref:papain-like cysteine protease family protein n=1 Tax=Sphingomonas yunnanensis TaxID=310400 RepID=UPI001CA6D7E6|nr:papain-like cysteine protease family protein [Sphingomonas yunnanensis]MBY9064967.1 hypothetical protein [Sphingomonas yunnanensis]
MPAYLYRVPGPIIAFDQGRASLCWLAASAVMFSWKSTGPVRLAEAADRLGPEFIAKYGTGSALGYADLALWASRGGFVREPQQCLDAGGWNQLLRSHGPLITIIDGNNSGSINHAVVVVGIEGDGGADTTIISIVNGQGGLIESRSLSGFVEVFELDAGQNELFSVLHL